MKARATSCAAKAASVMAVFGHLASVSCAADATIKHVAGSLDQYGIEHREYVATLSKKPRAFKFEASHFQNEKDWSLSLHGIPIEPQQGSGTAQPGIERKVAFEAANQDPFDSAEIVGENRLLHQCIRKLREDVPDARIRGLSLDMRCFYESWPAFRKQLIPAVKKTNGDVTIMGPPGGEHHRHPLCEPSQAAIGSRQPRRAVDRYPL